MKSLCQLAASMAIVSTLVIGCESSDNSPPSLQGAWLGTGTFQASQGSQDVKAQLEILPNEKYRFLILEPAILMMAGVETGAWTRNGDSVLLTPIEEQKEEKKSKTGLFAGAKRNFQPKTVTIVGNYEQLEIEDGPFEMTFTPNVEATKKLRESGELGDSN